MRFFWWGVVGVLTLFASRAEAADWARVFPADAVSSYLPTRDDAVIVVAADGSAETRGAAAALERAFRSGGRARLVLSDVAIRGSAFEDDKAIVRRCAGMPVTVIAAVRVLKGSTAQHAIVALYSNTGESVAGFSGSSAAPVTISDKSSQVGAGVSADAAAAVSRATGGAREVAATSSISESGEPRTDAEKQFLTSYLFIPDGYAAPHRGKYQERISWSQFYFEVGGAPLRYRYNRNRVLKVSGMLLAPAVLYLALDQPWRDGVIGYDDKAAGTVALSLLGVSAGMCSAGYYLSPHPVSLSERRRLADEYNNRLKEKLGLASGHGETEIRVTVGLAPYREGGAVALAIAF